MVSLLLNYTLLSLTETGGMQDLVLQSGEDMEDVKQVQPEQAQLSCLLPINIEKFLQHWSW